MELEVWKAKAVESAGQNTNGERASGSPLKPPAKHWAAHTRAENTQVSEKEPDEMIRENNLQSSQRAGHI